MLDTRACCLKVSVKLDTSKLLRVEFEEIDLFGVVVSFVTEFQFFIYSGLLRYFLFVLSCFYEFFKLLSLDAA